MFDDVVNIIIWSKIYTVHKKKKKNKSKIAVDYID